MRWLIIGALLCLAWVPVEGPIYPWPVNCQNERIWDGYISDPWGVCVPGMPTEESWYFQTPPFFYGKMSSYAHGAMPPTPAGYAGSVASMSCADIGKTYWLRLDGKWTGPYLVQDCTQRNHLWANVMYVRLAVEVDYRTALELGPRADRVDVAVGELPPEGRNPVPLNTYWENLAEYEEWRIFW